jgi:Zn-dependent metalloprotease
MPRRASALFALFCLCAVLAPLSAASQPPTPRAVPGRGTRAPSFVTGIEAPVRRGPAAAAARAHLSANRGRYHVDEERLKTLEVIPGPHTVTVRFGQTYKGIEVFGAQYLVHMNRVDGGFSTESVNGHVFSDLDVDVTPRVSGRDARRLAVHRAPSIRVYRVEPHGQTVMPVGRGVPAYHFTLWGRRLTGGQARQEVFVSTKTGATVLTYNNIQTDGPAVGSGVDVHGRQHELNIYQRGAVYELRDQSRPMFVSNGGEIITHDAQGAPRDVVSPTDQNIVTDDDTSFIGSKFTTTGAVDAHWAAGRVYEFYRALGRNSIDDNGMSIVSLVNVSDSGGGPFYNASWNGSYMTYGNPPGEDVFPFSAGLDVVGHELTHGVTDFSAGLVSLGQAGVMNEAYSDYFGNAIEVNESGEAMDSPGVGFIGEDLCAVPDPENFNCPVRNLNTNRTTQDFILFLVDFDNGGVHINAPIYGAALWDIREALGGPDADRLVYKALTEFTTPIDSLVDGRNFSSRGGRRAGLHRGTESCGRGCI